MDLDRLHEKIRVCQLCDLSRSRIKAVPGEGPCPAQIMLVGEAPGREEDLEGRPFVGRRPITTPMLIVACTASMTVIPKASILPKWSGALRHIRSPHRANPRKSSTTEIVAANPSSSPMMAKMKSV